MTKAENAMAGAAAPAEVEPAVPELPAIKDIDYNLPTITISDWKERALALLGAGELDYKAIIAHWQTVRNARLEINRRCKDLKEPAKEYQQAVDAEAKRLTALLTDIEEPLQQARQEHLAEKEREKAAKKQREADIRAEIDRIKQVPFDLLTADSEALDAALNDLKNIVLGPATFDQWTNEANDTVANSIAQVEGMLAQAKQREEQEAELARLREQAAQAPEGGADGEPADSPAADPQDVRNEHTRRLVDSLDVAEKGDTEGDAPQGEHGVTYDDVVAAAEILDAQPAPNFIIQDLPPGFVPVAEIDADPLANGELGTAQGLTDLPDGIIPLDMGGSPADIQPFEVGQPATAGGFPGAGSSLPETHRVSLDALQVSGDNYADRVRHEIQAVEVFINERLAPIFAHELPDPATEDGENLVGEIWERLDAFKADALALIQKAKEAAGE